MQLTINHNKKFFALPSDTLEALVCLETGGKTKGIAVALNNRVIPQQSWADTPLHDQDVILIITAAQGG